ncbi:MAG TPA: type II toxin-antitoxin system VapC family toxin [Ktedonobacteraceae bacterium]|nr:type II toxin-antitoxin system VapC family toxin [Ktedonobacteraceae bacterium]
MNTKSIVVDTSIVIKWAIKEEQTDIALALLADWTAKGTVILAPALLSYEATNVFHQRIRRADYPFEDARRALYDIIYELIVFDFANTPALHIRAIQLSQQFGLPAAYDAHYLALAEREQCELWTADRRMWNSIRGKLSWVRWLGDYQPAPPEDA